MENFTVQQKPKLRCLVFVLLCMCFMAWPIQAAGETPEETLAWCESLALEASEMAFKAQATCDYPIADQALNLANDAAYLVAKVSRMAQETANPQLALSAYNVGNQVKAAIANVVRAANHIASHSPNSDVVHAVNFLLDSCESMQKSNRVSLETALAPLLDISKRAEAYSK